MATRQAFGNATSTVHEHDPLSAILDAESVAILGASDTPMKISGRPLAYMLARGYSGKVYAVNPARTSIQGLPGYPSIAAIGAPVDLAIVATAAEHVERLIDEGIRHGVKSFVVFSSGFAEVGDTGRAMQERLSELARTHNVSILGPNCLGAINSRNGLIASFTTALESTPLVAGNFSFASQSGALGAYWLDIVLRSGLGFSRWVTTGNECDVDIAQAILHLVNDEHTRVIGVYIEDIRNPVLFRHALQKAAIAGKPVIAIKAGKSEAGAAAAASHTGALVDNDVLYDACLKQYGAIRVDSLTEMMDMARLLIHGAAPAGRRLGVMSVSGGAGVLIADASEPVGLTLPAPSGATCEALRAVLPPFVHPANPLDITGNVLQDTGLISRAMETLTKASEVDALVLFIGMMHSIADAFVETLTRARETVDCPIIVIWVGAMESSVQQLESHGIPVFLDIPQAITAIARGCDALERGRRTAALPPLQAGQVESVPLGNPLSEWDSKQMLRGQSSVQLPEAMLVTPDHPAGSAAPPPFPVVAKLQSSKLLHKSDAGGIVLSLKDDGAVKAAVASLLEKGQSLDIPLQGVMVEAMVPFEHELLLGLQRHSRFGPALTLARGGVEAELDPDTVTRLLPLTEHDIVAMLQSLRCARLLQGFRGRPGIDLNSLAASISGLCGWFLKQDIAEIEINPLAVGHSKAWALDALITTGNARK